MAGGYDGEVRINTKLNTNQFQSGMKSMLSSISGITRVLGIAFSVTALVKFGKEAITLASDLQEVDNVVDKAFGNMRDEMDALADSSIKNLGMSRLMAYQTGSTFMSMGKSMVASSEDAKNMALELTKLTANMASFFNVSQDLAGIALKSVYTGETETLKQYGVVMTEVNLKQFALEQGITKSYDAMTQSEKVMLRYQYVMNQLSYIGDDFIDTQDSWANQTRILSEQWKEFMIIVGNGLVTVLTPVVKMINSVVAALIRFAKTISDILANVFGVQMQQMGNTSTAVEGVASGYSDAADAVDAYADSTKKAAKAASGALAPLDELNVISKDSGKDATGGTGGADNQMTIEPFQIDNTEVDAAQSKYEDFFQYLTKLREDFVNGFQSSWGNLDITSQMKSIQESVVKIKNLLLGIFTDGSIWTSVDNLVQNTITSFGSMAASMLSIGATVAQNLLGGLSIYLEQNLSGIKDFLISMFDISADIAELQGTFTEAFAYVFQAFGSDTAQQITADLLQIFTDVFGGIMEVVGELVDDLLHLIIDPFVNNQEEIRGSLEGLLGVIETVTGTISQIVSQLMDGVKELYEEHIAPAIHGLTAELSEFVGNAQEFWNQYINPILQQIATRVEETYNEHLKPVIDTIIQIVGQLIDIVVAWISDLWNNTLKPLIEWIKTYIVPVLAPIISLIIDMVSGVVNGIIDFIGGLLSAIKDVFAVILDLVNGDWKKAWEDAKSIVKDVVNGILKAVESMANGVINGVNGVIRALNKIKLPDWLPGGWAGKGFNLQEIQPISIPRLANGGITTGSTLANIGEAGREAVLPLENNLQYLSPLGDMLSAKLTADILPYLRDLVDSNNVIAEKDLSVNIGDRDIARANSRGMRSMGMQIITT
jgi:phage-related protein